MRDSMKRMNFSDQVNLLSAWFKEWSDCEQTVALYTLLKRVNTSQARFLDLVLEQMLAESEEYIQLESEANNPAFIGNIQNDHTALPKLLAHLPLLQPGSTRAKAEYMRMIPKILSSTLDEGLHSEESRQLLSYFMIHPAVTREERDSLSKWFVRLHEHSSTTAHGQLSPENSSPPSPSATPEAGRPAGKGNGWLAQNHQCSASSDSGIADTSGLAEPPHIMHSILENTKSAPPSVNVRGPHNETIHTTMGPHHHPVLQNMYQGRRSLPITPNNPLLGHMPSTWSHDDFGPFSSSSLHPPSDHAPLSPTSSASSNEAHSEDGGHQPLQARNSFMEEHSGMRDVPAWLKSLRLHKYNSNFQQLSYDEMMELNEEKLKTLNITEGARKKILREIVQLRNRQNLLRELEKQLLEDDKPTTVREVLNRLKEEVVGTPLKKYEPPQGPTGDHIQGTDPDTVPEGDIPGQLSRLLGKMLSKFLVQSRQDAESIKTYLDILNKYVNHEAFTDVQRTRLMGWRKCFKNFQSKQVQDRLGRTWSHQGPSYGGPVDRGLQRCASAGRQPLARKIPYQGPALPTAHIQQNLLQVSSGATGVYRPTQSGSGYVQPRQGTVAARTPVSRTKSVPPQGPFNQALHPRLMRVNSPYYGTRQPDEHTSRQLENQFEDLCLSVTAHALGDGPNDEARDE